MNPTKNMPEKTHHAAKASSSLDIFFIIILGISGMLGMFQYMLHDLKISGYKKELWTVRDSARLVNQGEITVLDTLTVIYHPQIAARTANVENERAPAKENKLAGLAHDKKRALDFERIYFAYNSNCLVWIAIFSVLMGCSLALLPVILSSIKDIVLVFELSASRKIMVVFSTMLIGVLIYFMQHINYLMKPTEVLDRFNILLKNPYVLDGFIVVAICVALTAIAGQLFINQAIGRLPATVIGLDVIAHNIIAEKFNLLRRKLKFFLLIDAALIVLSVVNTDAFRRAIVSEVSINMDIVPRDYVYLYGVLFTFLLAIVYMPIYARLKNKGELMLKEIPQNLLNADGHKIASVLNIKETPIESLKVVLSILAPVLTSLVPGLLNI